MQVLILVSVLASALAVPIPKFILPCKIKDPDFHDCALKAAHYAVPHVIKGVRSLKIPPLDPLHLPEVQINSANINIKLTQLIVNGLSKAQVMDLRLSKKYGEMDIYIKNVEILAHYVVDGRILILPITGNGSANFTAVGGNYTYLAKLEPFSKDGKTYAHVKDSAVKYKLERAYFQFENLFGGDKGLGTELNKFLNENWEDVLKDLGGAISETVGAIVTSIIGNIFEEITQEELFLE